MKGHRQGHLIQAHIPPLSKKLVRVFFKDKLKLDSNSVNQMRIIGCHRLGKQFGHKGRPRSIIVRFLDYNDRHIVWKAKKDINVKTLSIHVHFCGDTEFKRRKLYPIIVQQKKRKIQSQSLSHRRHSSFEQSAVLR